MFAPSDDHVRCRSQEANRRSEGERVQQPQQDWEVVRLTFILNRDGTNQFNQIFLGAVTESVGACGWFQPGVDPVDFLQLLNGNIMKFVLRKDPLYFL